MAFQGKGILGGFSGKVGNVMGYSRNGKDIIQSLGKKPNSASNVVLDWQPLVMIDPRGCIINGDTVTRNGFVGGGNDGARSPYIMANTYGGIGTNIEALTGSFMLGLKNLPDRYNYRFHKHVVQIENNRYRIFRYSVPLTAFINVTSGSKIRLIANKKTTKVFIALSGGRFNMAFDYNEAPDADIYGFVNMFVFGGVANKLVYAGGKITT